MEEGDVDVSSLVDADGEIKDANQRNLYRVIQTVYKMLSNRGYVISEERKQISAIKFLEQNVKTDKKKQRTHTRRAGPVVLEQFRTHAVQPKAINEHTPQVELKNTRGHPRPYDNQKNTIFHEHRRSDSATIYPMNDHLS